MYSKEGGQTGEGSSSEKGSLRLSESCCEDHVEYLLTERVQFGESVSMYTHPDYYQLFLGGREGKGS